MNDFKLVKTTAKVFNAIFAEHDLAVFGGWHKSAEEEGGEPGMIYSYTTYGILGSSMPTLARRRAWTFQAQLYWRPGFPEIPLSAKEEEVTHYLCVATYEL